MWNSRSSDGGRVEHPDGATLEDMTFEQWNRDGGTVKHLMVEQWNRQCGTVDHLVVEQENI